MIGDTERSLIGEIVSPEPNLWKIHELLECGLNPNAVDNLGISVLILAAQRGHKDVVKMLLDFKANPNYAIPDDGNTALLWALWTEHVECARVLVEGGADIHAKNHKGESVFMGAAQNGYLELIDKIIAEGEDVNEQSDSGTTPLMEASYYGQPEAAKKLLQNGANPNLQDNWGFTALMHASEFGRYNIVSLLVKEGADTKIKNNFGKTAKDKAKTPEISQILEQAEKGKSSDGKGGM